MGKSRNQLYTEAMADFLGRHDPETVTERIDEVLDAVEDKEDHFVSETTRSVLEQVEW